MHNKKISKLMQEETITNGGCLEVFPEENVKVDSWNEYIFTYTTGQDIFPGGSLRITIPHFFTTPQVDKSEIPGYTCLAKNNEIKASISLNTTYACCFTDDGHSGSFGKSIFIRFLQGATQGQKLILRYGAQDGNNRGAKAPSFSCNAYFLASIDPYNDKRAVISGYYLLEEQVGIKITGKSAKKATIFIPSVSQNKTGKGIVHLTDINDNIDTEFKGKLKLFASNSTVELPNEINLSGEDNGIKTFPFKTPSGKDFRVEVVSEGISGISNFCAGKTDSGYNIFWGEYHVHTYASDGLGTIKEALDYGREEAALDFAAVNDHLCFNDESWDITKRETEEANEEGRFVTLFGFEVTTRPNGCDYCLISPDKNLNIDELMSCEKDSQYHAPMVSTEKYYETMASQNTIIIPHFHLGNGAIWDYEAPSQMKLAEIYSCWGAHEYENCALPSYGLPSIPEGEKDKK